jgi:hypothetical protein
MLSTRVALLLLLTIIPLTLSAQDLALVESVDRPLVRQNPDELALELETGPGCQIGLDLLADTVLDVLRRGGIKTSESPRPGRDHFALRVALRCGRGAFLVEVDFVDRVPPATPGGPAGPAFRYLPGYPTYGALDSPQRTLAAVKRCVEAAVNEYLRANFTTR